ncbi:MAG: hypothetical protein FD123_2353 [Bacteroidetes bacterium]|nr:MAG: hypothetical protein FD123_2353 [Bacteroidota bacterium]
MKTIYRFSGITVIMLTSFCAGAQTANGTGSSDYKTAVGIRAGGTSGLTFKRFTGSGNAFEVIAGAWSYGFSVTGLYERHANAGAPGLNWYYGGGAHVAAETGWVYYRNYYYDRRYDYFYRAGNDFGIGVDGIIGLEYKIKPIPFAVSLDLKPFVEVNTAGGAYLGFDPGLGIKVAF